ncbi:DnaJ domain-containing protein [Cynara cardunculus var. scolymus]|uniref:DnaJ domain-containing protein n=1 Tax=Cynara cardunculus var. scolymus TaxID=59895 RepID=A0A124SD50_CYNCS|nr:DnaJ domain-containing protein [Cynara cardunculus var. scolymus]
MHSIIISPYTLTPSRSSTIVPLTSLKSKTSSSFWNWNKSCSDHASLVCKASGSTSSSITDFDLYDLLGVDSSSDHLTIKQAYRTLQKKCHPDIAGVPGHDMAIILNEAYAVLSDPLSRFSYDKEQAKVADFKGYTGKPIYSVWYGSESEQRAIFVDEVKCVGCLKCALFAEKTFAIESVYGRARVIAQWADPENKIQEAIGACPVDCISMVERSKLAALEFLMSKQPRGSVRIGAGNTVAIRSITNWLYWQPPIPGMPATQTRRKLLQLPQNSTQSKSPNIDKLRDAAAARKQAQKTAKPKPSNSTEYWTPSPFILPESTNNESDTKASHTPTSKKPKGGSYNRFVVSKKIRSSNPYETGVPVGMAIVAAVVVRLQLGDAAGGIETHIGGSLLLDVVNSSWLQVILAGVTWYLVGMAAVELVAALRIKSHEE